MTHEMEQIITALTTTVLKSKKDLQKEILCASKSRIGFDSNVEEAPRPKSPPRHVTQPLLKPPALYNDPAGSQSARQDISKMVRKSHRRTEVRRIANVRPEAV